MKHIPSGITVKTQRFRELVGNRKEARKLLMKELDKLMNGTLSKEYIKDEKTRAKKAKQAYRTRKKQQNNTKDSETASTDDKGSNEE